MGGVLVYDAYSRIIGCQKIEQYYAANPPQKVHLDTVFSKAEMKEVARDFFSEKARERDFATDNDKLIYKNLPRFQS